ncbi:hypothetical protein AVEN_70108-1 [Araneus ventricosus]|uniref:Uncharacterized protein n=1 Tax=Araneus ventricosus TaxID=182803 RepID=A0A4Y2IWL6_ARAVE|nr:hypothetical protein AVEN_70108-1 [Araneus ventricosus]
MKQKMKEFQTQESEKMSKKAKSGCKEMLKGLQNEDGDNLQKIENADFRGQMAFAHPCSYAVWDVYRKPEHPLEVCPTTLEPPCIAKEALKLRVLRCFLSPKMRDTQHLKSRILYQN